jgi:hypothetical protein
MRQVRRRSFGWVLAAALALGMILGGCGVTSTRQVATSTATPAATDTPFLTPTTDPATLEQPGCPPVGLGPVPPGYGMVDGLKVSVPQRWTSLDYPSELMPNNLPNAPYQVPLTATEAQEGIFHPNPPVNPGLANGYAIEVCNQASASHSISSLKVSIASFTPRSGPITVWHICGGGAYDAATKQITPGCGGALGGVDFMAATLPSDRAGASAPAVANPKMGGGPNPPIALGTNTSIVLLVAVNGLTSQGTYALSFALSIDGAAATKLTPSDGPFFIAPSSTVRTGTACQTPAMQARIPSASKDTYYVCPPAS